MDQNTKWPELRAFREEIDTQNTNTQNINKMLQRILSYLRPATGFSRVPHSKLLGAQQDFHLACSLLELNELIVAGADPDSLPATFSSLRQKWGKEDLPRLIPFANNSMTIQLSEMFQHLHDIDNGDLLPSGSEEGGKGRSLHPSRRQMKSTPSAANATTAEMATLTISPSSFMTKFPSQKLINKLNALDSELSAAERVRLQLQLRHGFALWLGPSQAAHGRYEAGVYLRGKCAPGSVVAVYPGAVYSSEMTQRAIDYGHLGNPRVLRSIVPRFDDTIIDCFAEYTGDENVPGKDSPGEESSRGNTSKNSLSHPLKNAYALAQHVRHPPEGVSANVMRIQVDYVDNLASETTSPSGDTTLAFPPHLRSYIPSWWGAKTSAGQALYGSLEQHVICKGSVLIALRPLFDEEIFLDHTLNPFAKQAEMIPPWALKDWEERGTLRRLSGTISESDASKIREANTRAMQIEEQQAKREKLR